MASFNFQLKDYKTEGKTPIRLQILYGSKGSPQRRLNVYIGESVKPGQWTQKSQKVKGISTAPEVNGKLSRFETAAKKALLDYQTGHNNQDPPPEALKRLIEIAMGRRDPELELSFFEYFEQFIDIIKARQETTGKKIDGSTVRDYERTLFLLKGCSKRLAFNSTDEAFYHKFVKYLKEEHNFKVNTVGKHIKNLKAFMNWARKKKYHTTLDYQDFRVLTEEATNLYLTEQELQIMKDLDLRPELVRYRDSFLIACWTGLRYSDFSRLTSENIDFDNQVIRIQTKKTGTPVVIPFLPELKDIMEKYKEKPLPSYANQPMNRYLKEIGRAMSEKIIELNINGDLKKKDYSQLTTHTGRRSFCSNMYYRGIDIEMIMAISGHRTETLFRKYIKVENEDKAMKFLKQAQENKPVVKLKIAK